MERKRVRWEMEICFDCLQLAREMGSFGDFVLWAKAARVDLDFAGRQVMGTRGATAWGIGFVWCFRVRRRMQPSRVRPTNVQGEWCMMSFRFEDGTGAGRVGVNPDKVV